MTVNSTVEIQERAAAGKVTWTGPLIMLAARSILALICQTLVRVLFFQGKPDAWDQAGAWWRIYGTAIDVGCLVLLVWLTDRESIRLLDLGSYRRDRWLRDVLIGLGFFVPLLLAFAVPTVLLGFALWQPCSGARSRSAPWRLTLRCSSGPSSRRLQRTTPTLATACPIWRHLPAKSG